MLTAVFYWLCLFESFNEVICPEKGKKEVINRQTVDNRKVVYNQTVS
jgi:hypothetical protein